MEAMQTRWVGMLWVVGFVCLLLWVSPFLAPMGA
jgi:hypothetical protein